MFYLTLGEAGVTAALQKLQATDPELAEVWRTLALEYSNPDARRAGRAQGGGRSRRLDSPAERARMFGILFGQPRLRMSWWVSPCLAELRYHLPQPAASCSGRHQAAAHAGVATDDDACRSFVAE